MFKKIIGVSVAALAVIVGFVYADGWGSGGHSITLPNIPLPSVSVDTSGLLALLTRPPIPIVKLPSLQSLLPAGEGHGINIPLPNNLPVISLGYSGGHGGHGGGLNLAGLIPNIPIGDILNNILGGDDHWAR